MPPEESVYAREQLHAQVWSTPISTLAKQVGVSNVALARACRRLNIPVPQRGYWARRAAGQDVPAAPLPPAKPGQPTEYRVAGWRQTARSAQARAEMASRQRENHERQVALEGERKAKDLADEEKVSELLKAADDWHRAERLRGFIQAVEATVAGGAVIRPGWSEWARTVANELDPLNDLPRPRAGPSVLRAEGPWPTAPPVRGPLPPPRAEEPAWPRDDELWTVNDAANFLGCSTSAVYKWAEWGEVPVRRIGFMLRFVPSEVAGWAGLSPGTHARQSGRAPRRHRAQTE